MSDTSRLPTLFQEFIHLSRYARWKEEEGRRETWTETVDRYINYMCDKRLGGKIPAETREELRQAILTLKVLPSMRCLMTAGVALDVNDVAAYNCAYIAVDHPHAFDEMLMILMCGTGVGFSVERQFIANMLRIPDKLKKSSTTIEVADSKEGWAQAFRELISMLYAGIIPQWDMSKIRPAGARLKTFGGRACLTGDTIVYKDRKKTRGYNEITISDLFDMQNSTGKWESKPNHFKDVSLRSLDEDSGEFFRNRILKVIDNGIAQVYQIVTKNGYRIKATDNHRFMNDAGVYSYLSDFRVGSMIAVNGSMELKTGICVDCGTAVSRRAIRCKPCYDKTQLHDECQANTSRARLECQGNKKDHCERCSHDGSVSELQVHHIDENPHNNDIVNLMTLCEKCHRIEHFRKWTFGDAYSHKYLSYDEIISIEHVGAERVFDLAMQGPNHNFIANGFVSHNSGPEPLNDLFNFTTEIFKGAIGRKLNSIECHDICCKIAEIVVVGGVRRSACISLSNPSDDRMRYAKAGEWWKTAPYRALSNNSACYTEKPGMDVFLREWLSLYDSKSGERGIFNREAAQKQAQKTGRRKHDVEFGCNPCSEVVLRSCQFCNLTEVVVRAEDTEETLMKKVRLAVIMGTMQASLTNFGYLRPIWKQNTEEEALLGVSITGVYDNPLTYGADGKRKLAELLERLRLYAIKVNKEWAKVIGINQSVSITCVKPSGTVSQLVNCASGLHARFSKHYIRTVRADKKDPLAQLMKEVGFPCEDDVTKPEYNWVFSFPVAAPDNAIVSDNVSALEHLELWKTYQDHWCEHKPSVTVYVREGEWLDVGAWVYRHFDSVSGVAFLPFSGHTYRQAPYTEVTKEEYEKALAKMPKEVDWNKLKAYELEDTTHSGKTMACNGQSCELVDLTSTRT